MRHIITGKERGHRRPLSEDESTVNYTIRMPESLKDKCLRLGASTVRKIIDNFREAKK